MLQSLGSQRVGHSWVLTLDPGKQEGLRGLVATPGRGGLVSGGLLAQYDPRVPRSPLLTPALLQASLALWAQLCRQLLLSPAQCVPPGELASRRFLAAILSSAAATALVFPRIFSPIDCFLKILLLT